MTRLVYILYSLCVLVCLVQCNTTAEGVRLDIAAEPFEHFSSYQFFKGELHNLEPNEGVLPYDLNSPLFSDYAHKARFVWMPKGKNANYTKDGILDFPVGTALIKHFYYYHDERNMGKGKRLIESRLLVKRKDKWDALNYTWDAAQKEATLDVIGGLQNVEWLDENGKNREVAYMIPNKNQCKGCHAHQEKLQPIGPKVRNLNKEFDYVDGRKNQLEKWAIMGYLSDYEASKTHPKVAKWDDVDSGSLHERAMAYLDINCGHCHNPHGPANTSGLHLVYEQALDNKLGIYKTPVATGRGSGGRDYSIVPGKAHESILTYRMESIEPAEMMPELGRRLVHEEGVALITKWIDDMEN